MSRDTAINILIRARDLATRPITATGRALEGLNSTAAKVGAAIATYFSARAVGRFFSGALGEARAFEAQMARVQAISGASGEALQKLSDTAEEMGRTTTFTAVEAAQGLELLSRAGLSATESVETLPQVLALARGNGLELAQAASLITSVTSGMGLQFRDAARVTDVLAKAASSANTDVEQLGDALSYAGPVAHSMGLSVEETAGILGRFADAGIRGSRAGTALVGILTRMQDPASAASRELEKLGISTEDPLQAIRELAEAGDAAGPALIGFGQRAGPALRALLAQGTAGVDELIEALEQSGGAAQAQAEIMNQNLGGAVKELESAWSSIRKELMDPLLEPITREVRRAADAVREFAQSPAFEQLRESLVTAFEQAAEGARRFLSDLDFDDIAQRTGQFAERFAHYFGRVHQALSLAWNTARIFINGFLVGLKGLASGVSGLVGHVAKAVERITSLFGLLENRVSRAAGRISDAAYEIEDAFDESLQQNIQAVNEGIEGFARAATRGRDAAADLAEDMEEVETQSGLTADALDKLGEDAEYVDGEIRQLGDTAQDTAGDVEDLGDEVEDLEEKAKAAREAIDTMLDGLDASRSVDEITEVRTALREAFEAGLIGAEEYEEGVERVKERLLEVAAASKDVADQAAQGMREAGDAARQAAGEVQNLGAGSREVAEGFGDFFAEHIGIARRSVAELSAATEQMWANATGQEAAQAAEGIQGYRDALESAKQEVSDLSGIHFTLTRSLGRWAAELHKNAAIARQAYYEQRIEAEQALEALEDMAEGGRAQMGALARATRLANDEMSLLDGQTLNRLHAAIDGATARMEALRQESRDTLASMEEELLRLQGREDELARRRQENRRAELQAQLAEARSAGDQESMRALQEALRVLEQIGREEAKQRRERERERKEQKRERRDTQRERTDTSRQAPTAGPPAPSRVVRIQVGGAHVDADADQAERFLRELERQGLRSIQ